MSQSIPCLSAYVTLAGCWPKRRGTVNAVSNRTETTQIVAVKTARQKVDVTAATEYR